MKFYNREKELAALKNLKGNFRVAVVGRRRIGKTRLIEEFFGKKVLTLFIPAEKSEKEIISDWSSEYKEIPKVNTFRDLFVHLFRISGDRTLFLDEIQNLTKVNKGFLFDLQRLIDKHKPRLVVSGSLIRTMKGLVENYRSPLFGRFDIIMKLRELDFPTTAKICEDLGLNFETALKFHAIFGGVPKYYELIEKTAKFDFETFILDSFIYYPRPLHEEVRVMLKEEFGKEQRPFFSLLSAISQGNTRLSEIANFVGKEQTKLTKYLHLLTNDFELVSREVPAIGSGKKGLYRINTNLVGFWFSNVWRYQEMMEKGEEQAIAGILKDNSINTWVGKVFESLIIELMRTKIATFPFSFSRIGRQWGKLKGGEKGKNEYEIDIVALNEKTKEILFGECKWQDKVDTAKILHELKEKAKHVEWNNETRKEHYAIFAKSFKEKIKAPDLFLFDLRDLEKMILK